MISVISFLTSSMPWISSQGMKSGAVGSMRTCVVQAGGAGARAGEQSWVAGWCDVGGRRVPRRGLLECIVGGAARDAALAALR